MKPEAKGKAHMIEEDVSSPRKRARKTTNQQDEGPGTTVRTFNTEQEDCLYDLYTNKTKLCDIHDFFVREYDFEGNEKSLKSYFFKLKAQRTSLSDEDDILDKLVLDRTQLVLDQLNKTSSTKVTKQFIAKFIKEWELEKSGGKNF